MQKHINKIKMVALNLLVMTFVIACSGGGSGPPPVLNYSGATTPVAITEDNARDILLGAYEGGFISSSFNILGAAHLEDASLASQPRMLDLVHVLAAFTVEMNLQPQQSGLNTGAIITDSDTILGSCGGSVYYDVEIDSIFGDFSGTADFRDYCDSGDTDTVIDGTADFSGDYDLFTLKIDDFTFIFRDMNVTSGSESYTLNGSLNGSATVNWADLNTNSVLTDVVSGKTYWLKDFIINADRGIGFVDIDLTGRYYDHDYGYVDIYTQGPFRIYDNDDWPASGILVAGGAQGAQGGNTMARLVVLDNETFQVEADTDGDGQFDDYNSGTLAWNNM